MAYALAHPERVRALVLVATAARFELPQAMLDTWKNVMLGRAQQPFSTEAFSSKTDFAVMREAWMEQVKTDPRVRYFDLVACNQFDVTARLGEIKVPTLIIAGTRRQLHATAAVGSPAQWDQGIEARGHRRRGAHGVE